MELFWIKRLDWIGSEDKTFRWCCNPGKRDALGGARAFLNERHLTTDQYLVPTCTSIFVHFFNAVGYSNTLFYNQVSI